MKTQLLSLIVLFTCFLTSANPNIKNDHKFVVVLDAGHGGKDPGRPTKFGYTEKEIALKIVLEVGKALENHKDIEVIYTRKSDKFLELHERAKVANKADADLFVSIHCNAHNTQAFGSETYVLGLHANQRNFEVAKQENEVIFLEANYEQHYEGFDPNSPESMIGLTLMQEEYLDLSIRLASFVQDNFEKKLNRKNRGVKQAGFWVLHNTYMPSVLIETGFITNREEGDYLNSNRGQQEISQSIIDAILDYKKGLDLNVGENIANDKPIIKDNSKSSVESVTNGITYKVQIAASSKKIEPKSYNFKGLDSISREHEGNLYKYFYGETSNYNQVRRLEDVAKKLYKSCFIVAYKDGKRIELAEALKSTAN
jgi:N-acetylmuramoyl-L-alanine amidase